MIRTVYRLHTKMLVTFIVCDFNLAVLGHLYLLDLLRMSLRN